MIIRNSIFLLLCLFLIETLQVSIRKCMWILLQLKLKLFHFLRSLSELIRLAKLENIDMVKILYLQRKLTLA